MNPIGVDDSEGSSAALGICARVSGVVSELEELPDLPERSLLEIESVPFLCLLMSGRYEIIYDTNKLTSISW